METNEAVQRIREAGELLLDAAGIEQEYALQAACSRLTNYAAAWMEKGEVVEAMIVVRNEAEQLQEQWLADDADEFDPSIRGHLEQALRLLEEVRAAFPDERQLMSEEAEGWYGLIHEYRRVPVAEANDGMAVWAEPIAATKGLEHVGFYHPEHRPDPDERGGDWEPTPALEGGEAA